MRAKTVNFERGLDPKDSLKIGNENVREFRKALREKDFFAPVLKNMIMGLQNKSISEKDAITFVNGAVSDFDKRKSRKTLWYDWYYDSWNNPYWNTNEDKLIIQIEMPENDLLKDLLDNTQDRKVICEICETLSGDHGQMFQIKAYARIKNDFEDFYENHFEKENVFYPEDESFTMIWACRLINYVVETVIKELG